MGSRIVSRTGSETSSETGEPNIKIGSEMLEFRGTIGASKRVGSKHVASKPIASEFGASKYGSSK